MLLVEPTAYSIRLTQPKKQGRKKKQELSQVTATQLQPGEDKDYARNHGRFRGAQSATDTLTPLSDPPFSEDDESEGAYLFVQATSCRRQVLCTVFVNPPPRLFNILSCFIILRALSEPIVPCCDICDPSLLDLVRPGPRPMSTTKRLGYSKHPNAEVMLALREWRHKALINDDHPPYLPASYILSEEAINKLASLSPCTESAVKGYLSEQWVFWSVYGSDVTTIIISSQPQHEKIVPSSNHQDEDRDEGFGTVHSDRDTTQHGKRRRSCSPVDALFSSAVTVLGSQPGSQRQKQARRVVPTMPTSPSESPSQPSYHFSQPKSQPTLYNNSTGTINNTTPGRSKSDACHASPAPLRSLPPPQLLVPSQYHLYPDPPLGPLSPNRPLPPHKSQPVMSILSRHSCHTPAHSTVTQALAQVSTPSRTLSHSQRIHHSNIYYPPYHSIPIIDPAVSTLQPRTPIVPSHHWSPTSTSAPNMSPLHPQISGISSPHSPFRSPSVVPSLSMGPHIAYQHRSSFQLSTPTEPVTPSRPLLPPPQYHQPSSGHAHPSTTQFGLFSPFPSPHPMVLPDKNRNSWNFSAR